MITVSVPLGDRSYPILIGAGLLGDGALLRATITTRQVMIVTNDRVGPLYLARLVASLPARSVAAVTLPDGEQYKDLDSFNRIMTALLEQRFERGCTIVALGGGVIGDIAGFAAAAYQRGVRFVQIPTTLLAQVDSAVGGKTAVNHALGKNMIGAFHQPIAVISDLDTLATLPDREFCAGFAEIIKYGLIRDAEFFHWLERHAEQLLGREAAALSYAVQRSCEHKAAVVAADEHESGVRALLNLGHTFGHAIEHALGYGVWLHGEAIAAGMCMAARLSVRLGLLGTAEAERISTLLARVNLPTQAPAALPAAELHSAMRVDKKNLDGRIRLVLLEGIGRACLRDDYAEEALMTTLGATAHRAA